MAPTLQRACCLSSLQSCPLGWEPQRAPLHEPRDISMLNGSHCHIYPDPGGQSRDTEPWATDPLCMDPSRRVLKDALGLVQQVTLWLLLAEAWISLGLGLRDSPAVAAALGACPVLWPRLRSLPRAATPAGFIHTVAPMTAVCRRCHLPRPSPCRKSQAGGTLWVQNPWGRAREVLEGTEFSSFP